MVRRVDMSDSFLRSLENQEVLIRTDLSEIVNERAAVHGGRDHGCSVFLFRNRLDPGIELWIPIPR
jgi:hypothetical protein